MHVRVPVRLIAALVIAVASAILLSSSDKPAFTAGDKAYHADPNLVDFVRPGLVLKILSAEIGADGTIKTRFRLTDPKGLPLDKDGIATPGAVSLRFVVAYVPKGQTQYVAYTTRAQTSPLTKVTALQASSDSGGVFEKVGEGEYLYTFKTKAPAGFEKTSTHTIGMWAARDLNEFDLDMLSNYDDDVFNFVPDGSKVAVTRDVVRTQSCNKCHDPLSAHDERKTVELCILCHTPQSTDPDTGNTVDFPVMIHKIHMGRDLPSVQAGKPYQIIGFGQAVQDYSTVAFPADARNCTFCHEQNTGAAQANAYLNPNRAACGACHDNVNFATGENHANGLPVVSDRECANCHIPQGELEFDASILGAHTIPRFSRDLPGTVFEILAVNDGVAGKRPAVTFSVKDRSGKPISISGMRLQLVLAGPTTDYASYVSEDVTKATGTTDGRYFWTFQDPIPANAKGTYAVGIEGYRSVTLMQGTKQEITVRDAGVNKVFYFSVDGSKVAPRRQVVSLANCNNCHSSLSLHGDNRNQIEQCVLCHNPNQTDQTNRPAAQAPPESVDFRHMIHKIHTGEEIGGPYVIFGNRSSVNDFSEVRFPGDRRDCAECHVNGSEQLPLKDNLLNVTSPRGLVNPMGPATAACTGCHTSVAAASHALANTTRLGESCAACHSTGNEFGVPKVHAR
jgi:OmcA/MtrC family decaheme c-type cytochrome